jgi:membrane protease YdiL (CAAX protease family)
MKSMTKTDYVEAANQGKNGFWIYLLVIVMTVGLTFVVQAILLGVGFFFEGNLDIFSYPPTTLLWITMLPFGAILIVLFFGIKFLHRRSIWSVLSPGKRFRWRFFAAAGGLWFLLSAGGDLILSVVQPENYQFNVDLPSVLLYFLIAIGLISIQISAEEFLFRGYLMQAFGRIWSNVLFVIISQALLFGLLHGANTEVSEYGFFTTMPFYIGIGILLGVLTIRTNGLEAALGVHFFNNLYATSFVTFQGTSLPSPALFLIKEYNPQLSLVVFFVILFVFSVLFKIIKNKINPKYAGQYSGLGEN